MLEKSKPVKKVSKNISVAIVVARFNETITNGLLLGAKKALKQAGVLDKNITLVFVPGSVEIPLAAKLLAERKTIDCVVCLGAVIKGETNHDVYVARIAADGIRQVMLETKKPIAFGILTCNTKAQAVARSANDQHNRGYEATKAALEMIAVVRKI